MRKLLFAFFVFAMSALAVNVDGRWWGEAVIEGNVQSLYITLIQEGNTLKGFGGSSPTNQELLTNGKVEGKKVTFDILPGGRMPIHFELLEEGEWLKGSIRVARNGKTVTGTVGIRRRTN